MKINNTTPKRTQKIILTITLVALLALGAIAYVTYIQKDESNSSLRDEAGINYAEPTDEEKMTGDKAKQDAIEASKDNAGTGSDPAPAPVQQNDGTKSVVGMNITAAYKSGENYRIQTLIQTVTSTGTCTLAITDANGATYTETVDVQALPSSSTCKGFTVPLNKLAAGTWKIDIKFENDKLRGSASKEVQTS